MQTARTIPAGAPANARRALRLIVATACFGSLAGCALAGNPHPPTLWLPTPVKNLTAVRVGNDVRLHWTMPRDTTDKVLLKGPQRAHFCWKWVQSRTASGPAIPCTPAGDGTFPPEKPVDASVPLPAELTSDTSRAAAFFVELQNQSGKTAGPSNPALVATGSAPPEVAGFGADTRADGVVLHWDKAAPAPGMVLRIHRTLVKAAGAARPRESLGAAPPEQQVLEVNLDQEDQGQALDRDADFDRTWRYTAERVLHVEADQHTLEIAGTPSAAVTIDAKDIYPPQVPRQLAAVSDAQAHAIDLSWLPDSNVDLAGYVVYRRDLAAGGAAERISGPKPVVSPSYSDSAVAPGRRYAYALSAVDRDGNESTRSKEVEEELPQ